MHDVSCYSLALSTIPCNVKTTQKTWKSLSSGFNGNMCSSYDTALWGGIWNANLGSTTRRYAHATAATYFRRTRHYPGNPRTDPRLTDAPADVRSSVSPQQVLAARETRKTTAMQRKMKAQDRGTFWPFALGGDGELACERELLRYAARSKTASRVVFGQVPPPRSSQLRHV